MESSNEEHEDSNLADFNSYESAHFMTSKLTLDCRRCNKEFYSNNKLHRHLRTCHKTEPRTIHVEAMTHMTTLIPVMESANKKKEYNGFAFRTHHYASVKGSLVLWGLNHEFCMDSGTFMSLIDRIFLMEQQSNAVKQRTSLSIKIRGIRAKVHDSSEFVVLDFCLYGKHHGETAIARLKAEFHLVDDLKAKVLIGMDVMRPEGMILDFGRKIMTIPTCKDMQVPISVRRKSISIDRAVQAAAQVTISVGSIMAIPVRVRGIEIPKNRDYSFFSKIERMLRSEDEYFAHVTGPNIVAIQVRNTSIKSYIVLKNLKVEHLRDYDEEDCFLTTSEDRHLAIASGGSIDVKNALKSNKSAENGEFMKTTLPNKITVYGDKTTVDKLQAIIEETSSI